jgi:nucleoside-diphosphate-sugar epimerase
MTRTRVLLTGANSFTGSHSLSQLLSLDTVSVRAIVDSAEAAQALQRQYHHSSSSSLDLLTVCERDALVPGAFDDALHDQSDPFHAVVHTLSSNHSDEADCLARFIKLQTDTVISFLKSIQDLSPTVTRVVMVTSLIPFARWLGDPHVDRMSGRAGDGRFRTSPVDTEYVLATSQASNNIVNDAVLAWKKQARPRFDIAVITAPSVYGPAVHPLENSSDLIETNRRIWNICSNEPLDQRATPPYGINHFSDVRVSLTSGL